MAQDAYSQIDVSRVSRLRVGIKWDPLERDDLGERLNVNSSFAARKKMSALSKKTKRQGLLADIFGTLFALHNRKGKTERHHQLRRAREQNQERHKALGQYLEQEHLASFDLDLYCLCYDRANNLVKYVSPVSTESRSTSHRDLAFIHSGDDNTGTGERFDEEMLVQLDAIDQNIDKIFFAIASISHGFDEIKGGSWAILNTAGEKEIASQPIATKSFRRLHVMASLNRSSLGWSLRKLSEFCLMDKDEAVPLHERIDEALRSTFFTKPSS